ncbi:HEAT repeat domain-containing protein [Desulfotomaculum sp. 1211_IL3151]|uniref:HEAT repeat domain-containing protein n=1 Tax=Desulfotomaculum sp. 1211_IL3151 TaxID=3084055 RepID=UPI002FDA341B
MEIKVQPRPLEDAADLATALKRLFTEEWGGPKSALALAYLRDIVIPDLISCLKKNWQLLANPTFREILCSKLNTQFAYPLVFATGLTEDILACTKRVLGVSTLPNNHPWQPWEIILRMFTIGYGIPEIAQKTGYPEAYLNVLHKKYQDFRRTVEVLGDPSEEQLLCYYGMDGNEIELIRFMYDFQGRFQACKNYYERLCAEQIIMDTELNIDPEQLITLFEGLFEVERLLNLGRYADLLKGSKTAWLTGESYYIKTKGYGLLSDWSKKQIIALLERLQENNLILVDSSQEPVLNISEQAARLIVPRVVPGLADEVQNILRSKARDKISRSTAVLQGKNPEVTVHIIQELVRRGDTGVIICFKALQRRVPKKIFLELIWACGQLGGKDSVSLLCKTILDRDSLVRLKTCQAMGNIAEPSFYFALINVLDDTVDEVREQAVIALGKLKMPSAVKHLERLINNPGETPQVQREARNIRAILIRLREKGKIEE